MSPPDRERNDPGPGSAGGDPRPGPRRRARLIALFLLGAVLFNPPLLGIFDTPVTVFGLPALHLYLFAAWAVLILGLALTVERR